MYKVGALECFGASDPVDEEAFVTNVDLARCKELCGKSQSCKALMVGHGNCWLRKDVELTSCMPSQHLELWSSVERKKLLKRMKLKLLKRLKL